MCECDLVRGGCVTCEGWMCECDLVCLDLVDFVGVVLQRFLVERILKSVCM